jgi:hypothetical protein
MGADILCKTAMVSRDFPKYFISRFKLCVVLAGGYHSPGDVRPEYPVTGFAKPSDASVQRFTSQPFPV